MERVSLNKTLLFLGGTMASGKTSIGREIARLTGRPFLDLDFFIEKKSGLSIPEIFERQGEEGFRRLEKEAFREICELESCVVALGGGTLLDEENRRWVEEKGVLIALDASNETLRRRIDKEKGKRPLAQSPELSFLLARRRSCCKEARLHIETDKKSIPEVAVAVIEALGIPVSVPSGSLRVVSDGGMFGRILVGEGLLGRLPSFLNEKKHSAHLLVGDYLTNSLYSERLGLDGKTFCLPRGEQAKSLSHVLDLYEKLAEMSMDREGVIVALGGGTVGDTAGFAAATWMRGIDWIQCPTTLLAQVDSSIGGKVGVDLRQGKNLVGAFHQPRLVLSDVTCLMSLSPKDYRQGLAEMVKYALGEDPSFFEWLTVYAEALKQRKPSSLVEAVSRCVALKLRVVAEDEKETSGKRARLNLGHTIGHALEASGDYQSWQHGDAVAVGLVVMTFLASLKGKCSGETLNRLLALLKQWELPHKPDRPWKEILPYLLKDKKFQGGHPRLVLPVEGASSILTDDVSLDQLQASYEEVLRWNN